VLSVRDDYNHGFFLILLLLLFVLTTTTHMNQEFIWVLGVTWIIIWLVAVQYNTIKPWLCAQCGAEVTLSQLNDAQLRLHDESEESEEPDASDS